MLGILTQGKRSAVKRPTIKDVAKQSGYSLSTVSLVINNRGYVSQETRQRIMDVVERLRYHPTRSARGLASSTSGNIGFIVTEDHFFQSEQFYTRVFLGTEFEARTHNFYILLTTVGTDYSADDTPRFLLERNVDGVILVGKVHRRLIDQMESSGIPCILVDYQVKRRPFSSVLIDNVGGARLAVSHLVQGGRRHIAFVGGDLGHPSIADRYEGYRAVLEENGLTLDPSLVVTDDPELRLDAGLAAMERLWKTKKRPDAVFGANDTMAIGCMQYLRQQGATIPDDVAVVGFDDIDASLMTDPQLSSIHVPKEEMGKLAVHRLVEIIKEKHKHIVSTTVPVELIVRSSSAFPQASHSATAVLKK